MLRNLLREPNSIIAEQCEHATRHGGLGRGLDQADVLRHLNARFRSKCKLPEEARVEIYWRDSVVPLLEALRPRWGWVFDE